MGFMPVQQILAANRRHARIFGHARVRRFRSIDKLGGFATGDLEWAVIASGNPGIDLVLGQRDFFGAKFRFAQKLDEELEYIVHVLLKAIPGERGRIPAATSLKFGSTS